MKTIFIFLLLLPFAVEAREELYVTADSLFVRKSPSKAAPPVGFIPFGTKVQVNSRAAVQSDGFDWLRISQPDGFVAAQFLAHSVPSPAKAMKLTSFQETNSCLGPAWYSWASLVLTAGKFRYKAVDSGGGAEVNTLGAGTYLLDEHGLRLNFDSLTTKSWAAPAAQMPPHLSILLTFVPSLNGFVVDTNIPGHVFPVLPLSQIPSDPKSLDAKSCSYKLTVCPTVPSPGKQGRTLGYFCTAVRPPESGPWSELTP